MAVPTLTGIAPSSGPTAGGDVVRLTGTGFAPQVAVLFGEVAAQVLGVRDEAGVSVVDVRTPAHDEALVDVVLRNLDAEGQPVPGEDDALAGAYRFLRPRIVREADLTRLVRTLLRELKRQVLAATSISVAVDFDDTPGDGLDLVAMAELPALVLSGPRLATSRAYATNVPLELPAEDGDVLLHSPPTTFDLTFTLTGASERTAELLNLMRAVAAFLATNPWIEMPRDPARPEAGTVRWELDAEGEMRASLRGEGDVRSFTCGLVIRGFDIHEGLVTGRTRAVDEPVLDTQSIEGDTP